MKEVEHLARYFDPPRRLNRYETALLKAVLSLECPGVDALRAQFPGTRVGAECSTCRTIGFVVDPSHTQARVVDQVPVEAHGVDEDGQTVHLLLHVVEGFIFELEPYREDDAEIRRLSPVEDLKLAISEPWS